MSQRQDDRVARADAGGAASWVDRAATLSERLEAWRRGHRPTVAPPDPTLVEAILRDWAATVGGEGPLDRRLADLGLTRDDVAALAAQRIEAPRWATVAADVSEIARARAAATALDDDAAWAIDERVPFASLWEPWIEWADRALGPVDAAGCRPDAVRRTLLELLRRRLVFAGSRAALEAFGDRPPGEGAGPYRRWVLDHLADGGERLFAAYPVLGRALAVTADQWVDAMAEFLHRLGADRADLARIGLPVGEEITTVAATGDPHRRGREVLLVGTVDGWRAVYKPRPVDAEVAFGRMARHLHSHGGVDADLGLDVLARTGYGWVRFVTAVEPVDGDVAALSRNCGGLLALAHVIGATDLHFENVVLAGHWPVVVDHECIAHSVFRGPGELEVDLAYSSMQDTVMRSGLLPDAGVADDSGIDLSGITSPAVRLDVAPDDELEGLGTASLRPRRRPRRRRRGRDEPPRVRLDVDVVAAGMRQAYAALDRHGLGIDLDEPLGVRLVPEGTSQYFQALRSALSSRSMAHGLLFSVALEPTAALAYRPGMAPWRARILDAERSALERLDIPILDADWRGTGAAMEGVEVDDVLQHGGVEVIRSNLRRLGAASNQLQVDIARMSLAARGSLVEPAPPVGATSALDAASMLGAGLVERAVEWRDGSLRWLNVALTENADPHASITGDGLYEGVAGVAVFLAALARETGDDRMADMARAALAGIRPPRTPALAEGAAGIAYAQASVGAALGDDGLVAEAVELIWRHRSDDPGSAPTDLLAGRSGMLAAAAAVAVVSGADRAAAATAELLGALEADWRGLMARGGHHRLHAERLGAAHGIGGTTLAVARAGQVLDGSGLEWLAELVEHEDARIAARGGVPARVTSDRQRRPDIGWCWGVAGFAAIRPQVDLVLGLDDPTGAVATARRMLATEPNHSDRLCCGIAGHLDGLDPSHPQHVAVSAALVSRAGELQLEQRTRAQGAGFFRGVSGVGHALLRTACPASVPSVLTLAARVSIAGVTAGCSSRLVDGAPNRSG